jgi:hypothetical protein
MNCRVCEKSLPILGGCDCDCGVMYCSAECLNDNWAIHRNFCTTFVALAAAASSKKEEKKGERAAVIVVREQDGRGRGLKALKKIMAGDPITGFTPAPALVMNPSFRPGRYDQQHVFYFEHAGTAQALFACPSTERGTGTIATATSAAYLGCYINDAAPSSMIKELRDVRRVSDVEVWQDNYNTTEQDANVEFHYNVADEISTVRASKTIAANSAIFASYGSDFWLNDAILDPGFPVEAKLTIIGFWMQNRDAALTCQWTFPALRTLPDPFTGNLRTIFQEVNTTPTQHEIAAACAAWETHFDLRRSWFSTFGADLLAFC